MQETFLKDLAVIMVVAGLVTVVFHRLKQPVVVGYILAGFLVGPHFLPRGLIQNEQSIRTLAELGIIFVLFSLGLNFSLRGVARVGATAIATAIIEIGLMVWIGYQLGQAFGWRPTNSIFLGAMMSITSSMVAVKVLTDLGKAKDRFAQIMLSVSVMEDIVGVAMLAVLSGLSAGAGGDSTAHRWGQFLTTLGGVALFMTAVMVAGLILVPRILRFISSFRSDEMLLVSVLGLCFGTSFLAASIGFSAALGAFLMGSIIAETRQAGRIRDLIEPVRDTFSALFFVAIGMLINPMVLRQAGPAILAIALAVIVGKFLANALGVIVTGNDRATAIRVGLGMAQIGEFSFIIASLGVNMGVLSPSLYAVVVSVSIVTVLIMPQSIKHSDWIVARFDRLAPGALVNFLDLYARWVANLGASPRQTSQIRALLRKWTIQITLNMVLVTGLFVAAGAMARYGSDAQAWLPPRLGGGKALLWLAAAILALPFLIATGRKIRAAGFVLAEVSVPRKSGGDQTASVRGVLANLILAAGLAVMTIWVLLVSSATRPPWPVLVTLLLVVAAIAVLMWRSFMRLYAKGQIALRETLAGPPAPPEPPQSLPPLLSKATLQTIEITAQSPAAGKLIRELALRTQSGASAVAIDREGASVVNPGPDEELRVGDKVLILGSAEQIAAAEAVLRSATLAPPAAPNPDPTGTP